MKQFIALTGVIVLTVLLCLSPQAVPGARAMGFTGTDVLGGFGLSDMLGTFTDDLDELLTELSDVFEEIADDFDELFSDFSWVLKEITDDLADLPTAYANIFTQITDEIKAIGAEFSDALGVPPSSLEDIAMGSILVVRNMQNLVASMLNSLDINTEWRAFVKLFEEGVDEYITILMQYTDNLIHMSILSDLVKMIHSSNLWTILEEEIRSSLSDENWQAFFNEIDRILQKLSHPVY
jgi:hypothetical protein